MNDPNTDFGSVSAVLRFQHLKISRLPQASDPPRLRIVDSG
jgi:hypothetical protein